MLPTPSHLIPHLFFQPLLAADAHLAVCGSRRLLSGEGLAVHLSVDQLNAISRIVIATAEDVASDDEDEAAADEASLLKSGGLPMGEVGSPVKLSLRLELATATVHIVDVAGASTREVTGVSAQETTGASAISVREIAMLRASFLFLSLSVDADQVILTTPYLLPLTYYCSLLTYCCLLLTSYCSLLTEYCLLLTAYYLLLTIAYCLLPTAYCLLLTAYCLLLTANCLLLTTYYLLLTTNYLPLTF